MSVRINADHDNNGRISRREWENAKADERRKTEDRTKRYEIVLGDRVYEGTLAELEAQLSGSGVLSSKASAMSQAEHANSKLSQLKSAMNDLQGAIKMAHSKNDKTQAEQYTSQLMSLAAKASATSKNATHKLDLSALGIDLGGEAKASTRSTRSGHANPYAARGTANAAGSNAKASTSALPSTWKAMAGGSSGSAGDVGSSAAYWAASNLIDDANMKAYDSIASDQKRGKQLMMMFYYFAKMAESGDLGSMYQFMKFITYIVSKDKAKQQIEMGKKLIQLQDLSRQWTDKLMKLTTDANDPNSSLIMTKVMTEVKSQTDTIALAQKLLGQTMEEFSQVVELMTNVTKNLLVANGSVLKAVSSRF